MRTSLLASFFVSLIVGAVGRIWYASTKAEKDFAYSRMERLYRESALEIKTYAKLLRLVRNGEDERVLKYLEALLSSAETTMAGTKNDVSEEVKLSVGKEAVDYLNQYRSEFPVGGVVAP